MTSAGWITAPGGYYGEAPAPRDGCAVDCPTPVGGDHLAACIVDDSDELDAIELPAIIPGACVGSGQSTFGPELRQTCPVCGRIVSTFADSVGRALRAHVAPSIAGPGGSAPSISMGL